MPAFNRQSAPDLALIALLTIFASAAILGAITATYFVITVSVCVPHTALIPIYWNRACPIRLPLPIIPRVNASGHRFGGFGFQHRRVLLWGPVSNLR